MSAFAPSSPEATENIAAPTTEAPLPAARYGLFLFTATVLIAGFYLYSALFLLAGSLLWLLLLLLGLLGSQYGGMVVAWPVLNAVGAALGTFARGLYLGRGVDFHLRLRREQAPRLWEVVEDLSRRLNVPPPREFVLENGVNAYVMLRGIAAGRGKTRLGVGYDLLAGLTEAQSRAVMAHEIAHAKYVRRGYQGFLMRGLVRLSRCAGALEGIAAHEENHKSARAISRWVGALPTLISARAGKLIAACSRYDEFLADRVAAEICGPAPCRSALLATHVLDYQADKIDYRERLLHLEREPGYSHWLRERLSVTDATRRAELETRALERAHRHELSTHPALPDRLAAIDQISAISTPVNDQSPNAQTQNAQTQNAQTQNANASSANAQTANSQAANAQSANSQNANAQNANAQTANSQAANAQSSNSQNVNAHATNSQTESAPSASAQNANSQAANAHNADNQNATSHNTNAHNASAQNASAHNTNANSQDAGAPTGLVWLHEPDAIAGLLLRHIEETAAKQEAKATRSLAKWMAKHDRESGRRRLLRNPRLWAAGALLLAVFLGAAFHRFATEVFALPGATRDAGVWLMVAAYAALPLGALAAAVYLGLKKPARGGLPVPAFALYREAQLRARDRNRAARERAKTREDLAPQERRALEIEDEEARAAKRIARGAQLRAARPADLRKPAAIARFHVGQAYEALARGDYAVAAHCARLVFEVDKTGAEAMVVRAICAAGRGGRVEIGPPESAALAKLGHDAQWALAWAACLNGDTGAAEAFTLQLARSKPKNPTVRALLAWAQAANGKPREALASRKLALQLAQKDASLSPSLREAEAACHRFVLLQNLTALGQLGEAQIELEWLNAHRARVEVAGGKLIGLDALALDLEKLKWQVARGQSQIALENARLLATQNAREARAQIEVGEALSQASEAPLREEAARCFQRALEIGFYPQAVVALSRLAYDRDDTPAARALLLESLDCTKTRPHDAAHPLSQLDDVINGLRLVDDAAPARLEGWEFELECAKMGLDVKQLFLLCLFPDEAQARAAASEIFEALLPGREWQSKMKAWRAAERYQPDEPMVPGVYGSRWTDE